MAIPKEAIEYIVDRRADKQDFDGVPKGKTIVEWTGSLISSDIDLFLQWQGGNPCWDCELHGEFPINTIEYDLCPERHNKICLIKEHRKKYKKN